MRSFFSSHPWTRSDTSRIPATAVKDSCNPMWAAEKGLTHSSRNKAKASEVGPSRSRSSRGASWSMRIITAARSTDGVLPAMPQNSATHRMVNSAVDRLPRPSRAVSRLARKARCIPDTATVWLSPARSREVVNSSVRLSRLPVTRARTKPETSSGKAASMPVFRALDAQAAKYWGGTRVGRSTSSRP